MKVGEAWIEIKADTDGFGRELHSGVDRHVDGVTGGMTSKFGGAFRGIAAAGVGLLAGGFLLDFGQQLYGAGVQLDVMRAKAETVFGDQIGVMRRWADASNEAFGVTENQLVGMASGFADLVIPMGFTREQAAKMSQDVIGLSGALSAWTGGQKSAAEVSGILASAMLGERESLKGLGISITEAEVAARLLAKGQQDLTGTALAQAEAIATQELIFEKSKDAQKAWADGSAEAIVQQNELKATIAGVKESLAEALMPAFQSAVRFILNDLVPGVQRLSREFLASFRSSGDTATTFGRVLGQFTELASGLFDDISAFVTANRATFEEWGARASSIMTSVGEVIAGVLEAARIAWNTFGETLMTYVLGAFDAVFTIIDGAMQAISGVIDVVLGVITGDWTRAWDGLKGIVEGVLDIIKGVVEGALNTLKGIVSAALDVIGVDFDDVWYGLLHVVEDAINGVVDVVAEGARFVVDIILMMAESIVKAADHAFGWVPGIGNLIGDLASGIEGFRDRTNAALSAIIDRDIRITADTSEAEANIRRLTVLINNIPFAIVGGSDLARELKSVDTVKVAPNGAAAPAPAGAAPVGGSPTIHVHDRSGNPVETARATALALRMV